MILNIVRATLQHGSGQFARESAVALFLTRNDRSYVHLPDVLRSDLDLLAKKTLRQAEVKGRGSNHDVTVGLELRSRVERSDERFDRSLCSILLVTLLASRSVRTSSYHR